MPLRLSLDPQLSSLPPRNIIFGETRWVFVFVWGLLFISIPEKDIPGNHESDEAGKGNTKKDILINVKELHVESQLKLFHSLDELFPICLYGASDE